MMRNYYIAGCALAVVAISVVLVRTGKVRNSLTRYVEQRNARQIVESQQEPEAAWFMHYPNSGGSHIIKIFQEITGKSTGTNYGQTFQDADGELETDAYGSTPIWENLPDGPFKYRDEDVPDIYVPIVTHCGGVCIDCAPNYYMLSRDKFWEECTTGLKFEPSGTGTEKAVVYDHKIIEKGVQIVRPPLDNAVGRFLQLRKSKMALGDETWLELHPETPVGFHSWCDKMALRYGEEESIKWPEEIWEASSGVPCRAEFFRYIQWHNNAHEITSRKTMDIPLAVVHTRDLQEDFQKVMDSLLWYFRLDLTVPLDEYNGLDLNIPGYGHYFDHDQRAKIACFMKVMSTAVTFDRLGRYMTECTK